jgi:hypothetical protein
MVSMTVGSAAYGVELFRATVLRRRTKSESDPTNNTAPKRPMRAMTRAD